jgi:hypothetical protein
MQAVQEAAELAQRSGAQTIIGVGSGAAMDLAKAVASSINAEQLILAPATLGGAMASMSEESLLLSTKEEALVPYEKTIANLSCTVALDPVAMTFHFASDTTQQANGTTTVEQVVLASLALALETAFLRLHQSDGAAPSNEVLEASNLVNNTIDNAIEALRLLDQIIDNSQHEDQKEIIIMCQNHAVAAALHAGHLVRLTPQAADGDSLRPSSCISLASAILPCYFPSGGILPFLSSLLPGICCASATNFIGGSGHQQLVQEIASKLMGRKDAKVQELAEWSNDICFKHGAPSLSSLADGTPTVSILLEKYDQYGALLNLRNDDEQFMGQVLESSLNR